MAGAGRQHYSYQNFGKHVLDIHKIGAWIHYHFEKSHVYETCACVRRKSDRIVSSTSSELVAQSSVQRASADKSRLYYEMAENMRKYELETRDAMRYGAMRCFDM